MGFNGGLSQFGHYVFVDDTTGKIGITTNYIPNVGIGTTNPQYKLDVIGDARFTGNLQPSDLNVTGFATFVGVSTFKSDVFIDGALNFNGDLLQNGQLFTAGIGIGSTTLRAGSDVISQKIGVGFTDINFVGDGLFVAGYGSTVVVDFTTLKVTAQATVPSLTLLTQSIILGATDNNKSYLTNTVGAGFTVTLPSIKQPGDFVEFHDTESTWDINNLMVETQNNEQFKNHLGVIDSPLACDVAGAAVKLVWTNSYWRLFT
mgnify:FL=1